MSRTAQIPVTAGGQLRTTPSISLDNCGPANFTRVLNMRRSRDQMVRREGYGKFFDGTKYLFDASETPSRLAELVRGDGTRAIIGASPTKVKWYSGTTWATIGTLTTSTFPWQAVTQSNVAIFNRGVVGELPTTWEIGDAATAPLYEAREQGIASFGRIDSYNGFLMGGDTAEIKADQLNVFMAGYSNFTAVSPTAETTNFTVVAPTDNQKQFNVTTAASNLVATLPALTNTSPLFYVWIKKSDAGAGTVTTSPVVADETVTLSAINDIALVWWNGSKFVAKVFAGGVIPSTTPYGIPPASILQHMPDEQCWAELGEPKNWSPLLQAYMPAASTTIYVPFVPHNWVAGQTRLAIVNGGPDGGTLGGQTNSPDGILLTVIGAFSPSHMGYAITIETTTDTANTYPLFVDVLRWTDVSAFTGKQKLGNGSQITAMFSLNGQQIISHKTGFFVNRFTANADNPFALREKYVGANVPMAGDCIAAYNSELIIYPTLGRNFFQFDGISDPQIHRQCEDAKDLFFSGLLDTDRIWATNNPLTLELYFNRPSKTMAFCYDPDSIGVSEIDSVLDAAVWATKPAATEQWFVMGIANKIYTYSMTNGVATSWWRDGVVPTARLTSGLVLMGAHQSEKTVLSFTPLLASPSPDTDFTVQIRSTHNANVAPVDLLDPIATLPDPDGKNFVPLFYQAAYFQDELVLVDAADVDWRLAGRIYEYNVVSGQESVTRSTS